MVTRLLYSAPNNLKSCHCTTTGNYSLPGLFYKRIRGRFRGYHCNPPQYLHSEATPRPPNRVLPPQATEQRRRIRKGPALCPRCEHYAVQTFYLESALHMVISGRLRYSVRRMQNNRTDWNSFFSTRVVRDSKKGVPFVPGILLMVLGLVVLVAPRLVLATIALCLLVVGGVCCYVAYKLVAFRRQVQALTKSFESSFQSSSFHSRKPDIDITELESKKIVFH